MKKFIVFIICCSSFILNGGKTTSLKNKGPQEIRKKLSGPQSTKAQKQSSLLQKSKKHTFLKRKKIYRSFNQAFTSLALLREELKNTNNCIDYYKADLKIRLSIYSTYADYIDAQAKITEYSTSFQNHFLKPTSSLLKNLDRILDIRSNLSEEADLQEQLQLCMDQTIDVMFAISEYKNY
jgi:hypothetical protein